MYSILIVDDETVILEGIKEVVLSSDLPLKEVKTASSAREAIRNFQKTPFDIILSDISMPEMDGLDMIQETRKIWPSTAVIILTGYQNFEYVRKALRLGTLDYLLKPVTDEQLIDSLKTIICNLDKEWFKRFYEKKIWEQTDKDLIRVQREYFISAFKSKNAVALITQERLQSLKIPMCIGKKVRTVVIRYEERIIKLAEDIEYKTHHWLLNILQNSLYGYEQVFGFQYNSSVSVFLLQPMSEQTMDDTAIYKVIEEMQSYFFEKVDIIMSIGILSGIDWKDWVKAVQTVIHRQEETKESGQIFIVDHAGYSQKEQNYPEEGENQNFFVLRIEEYVKKHLAEDLSLSALSDKFHINPSYLSRIFHRESGLQLSAFITEFRIERAKELLLKTDNKIYEIAAKVGFDTAGYFTKVFTKIVGVPPKEYRMSLYKIE